MHRHLFFELGQLVVVDIDHFARVPAKPVEILVVAHDYYTIFCDSDVSLDELSSVEKGVAKSLQSVFWGLPPATPV